ncbi:hypothetical protein D1871_12735 [Nakamurella silvestris]|nr:hypothetical protein D1871_12735 [Nakamurella silvestris]
MTAPPQVDASTLLDSYRARTPELPLAAGPIRFDEMVDGDGRVRDGWEELAEGFDSMGRADLRRLLGQVDRLLENDGVTYNPIAEAGSGSAAVDTSDDIGGSGAIGDADTQPQPWRLDAVPLILGSQDWAQLESGLLQRSTLLDEVLTDIYSSRRLMRTGLIPPEMVFGHPGYLRRAHGVSVPGAHQLFFHAADVFRAADGRFLALSDRTQAPSGAGYAMADRRVISRVLPDFFRRSAPHGLGAFFRTMRHALQSVAPTAAEDPRVVVLSPGTHSETAFDQAFLAALLGLPLVESADLTVREGRLWMRSLGRLEPVDVVLRRVDANFTDPLDLRPDSRLGVVGLVEANRRGAVTIVNSLGSGVLENPALLSVLPQLSQALLGEDLTLESVPTFWGGTSTGRSHILAHLNRLVLRRTDREESRYPQTMSSTELATLRSRIESEPASWVGQEIDQVSEAPVGTPEGLAARGVAMRMFSVAHQAGYVPMPGALGRVLPQDASSENGGANEAKDVWVRSGRAEITASRDNAAWLQEGPLVAASRDSVAASPRVLEDLFWFGRYTERLEDFTRLLMAAKERADDFRFRPAELGAGSVPVLLDTVTTVSTTFPGFLAERVDTNTEMRSLILDATRPGTIAHALLRLQNAASGVRDQLSGDTWMVLAGVDRALTELKADRLDQGAVLQTTHAAVLSGMLALSGLAAENMIRDPGWHLMDIGRRLERSIQLVVILRNTLAQAKNPAVDSLLIESVLQMTESILTYRRRYRGRTQIGTVLELLLLDDGNPRSLAYQLGAISNSFKALPDASGTSVSERALEDLTTKLRRCSASDLDDADADGHRAELDTFLDETHTALRGLADAIAAQHFWHPSSMQPLYRPSGDRHSSEDPEEERELQVPVPQQVPTQQAEARLVPSATLIEKLLP